MFEAHTTTIRIGLFAGWLVLLLLLELRSPYRPPSVSKLKRWVNNLGLTLINTMVLTLIFSGAPLLVAAHVNQAGTGLFNLWGLHPVLKAVAGILVLDFLLYVWHLLNHEMPLLWRFHRVHHSDLNMDASTATRFHAGELILSACIKIAWIYLLGITPATVIIFDSAIVFSTQFHHSTLLISPRLESVIIKLFITPSMHRIHHSVKIKERNTNYGALFSWWDSLMGTFKLKGVDQALIRIGVGGHYEEKKLNLPQLLIQPFTRRVP